MVENTTNVVDSANESSSASSTPNKTQAEIVRAAGAVVVNKAEMQSFEEWKEMKLKSGETGNNGASESSSISSSSASIPNSASQVVSGGLSKLIGSDVGGGGDLTVDSSAAVQRRKNYASAECGAKIIASNPESNKASNILSENKVKQKTRCKIKHDFWPQNICFLKFNKLLNEESD